MSFNSVAWASRQNIKPNDKLVLWGLADHHNDKMNLCYPSTKRLSNFTGLSVRSVLRSIKSLEEIGLIIPQKRQGTSNSYTLSIDLVITKPVTESHQCQRVTSDRESHGSDTQSQGGVTHSHLGSDTQSPKPVKNQETKPVKEAVSKIQSPIGSALSKIDQSKDDEIPNPKCGIFDQAGEEQIFDAFGEAPYFDKPPYRPTDDSPEAVAHRVLGYLNEQKARHLLGQHRDCESNYKEIKARIKTEKADEYTLKRIIDVKIKDWARDVKMKQYLTPSTLFCKKHFVKYCEQVEADEIRMASYWERQAEGKGIFDL